MSFPANRNTLTYSLASSLSLLMIGLLASGSPGPAAAVADDDLITLTHTARGGLLARSAGDQFEVFFYPTGIRLIPLDSSGKPLSVTGLGASATFTLAGSTKPWFIRNLVSAPAAADHPEASLDLGIDLSTVPLDGTKVAFEVTGLPGSKPAEFSLPFEFLKTQPPSAPPQAAPTPRYVYGPGYSGYRYYQYPGPQTAATAAASEPTVYSYAHSSNRGYEDPSTGRSFQSGGLINKPWLTPIMD